MDVVLVLVGAVIGSFLTAWTYRATRNQKVWQGRSKCDKCGKELLWYDNIPVISYLSLSGKCRHCGKKISPRYPLIEITTATTFLFAYRFAINCSSLSSPICSWMSEGTIGLIALLLLLAVLLGALFTDLEEKLIPDEMVFFGLVLVFVFYLITDFTGIYSYLLAGLVSAGVLLLIALFTGGKGMGLGDVKLAILLGSVLGPALVFYYMFTAFLTGALVGLILVLGRRFKLKQEIAFGPFLLFGFAVAFLLGESFFRGILGV